MRTSSSRSSVLRRLRPWLVGWFGFQAAVALAGVLAARRSNEGDASSPSIRRVVTHNGVDLRPTHPDLSRVRLDLAMAGGELDLTGRPLPPHGIDLTVRLGMAGLAVRVPAEWRVWWRFRGVGGIGADGAVQRTHDERAADLRIHAVVVLGGIGLEAS